MSFKHPKIYCQHSFNLYFQMWLRLFLVLGLAVSAYFVLRYFSTESFALWVETPAMATPVLKQPVYEDIQVASAGPNPPAMAPTLPPQVSPQPQARDPFDDIAEDANAPPQMRHPERSFGPGIVPTQTQIAAQAGTAGPVAQSSQPFQQFSPEFVQNGGSFFGDVSANEDENPNYSAF